MAAARDPLHGPVVHRGPAARRRVGRRRLQVPPHRLSVHIGLPRIQQRPELVRQRLLSLGQIVCSPRSLRTSNIIVALPSTSSFMSPLLYGTLLKSAGHRPPEQRPLGDRGTSFKNG